MPSCDLDLTSAGLVKVSFPFDAVTEAQLRSIRPRGRRLAQGKGWTFPISAVGKLQESLGNRFLIRDDLAQWLAWREDSLPELPSPRELLANADFEVVLSDGRRPLKHQLLGARWLVSRRAGILADDMGLGKTLTALLAARVVVRSVKAKVMVIAPVGLHPHWRKEARSLGIHIDLQSWFRLPMDLHPSGTVLIVDEAHFAQSLDAKRTQCLLRLARHPRLRFMWMLTGTPMKNGRPSQLYPLLLAMGHPLSSDQRAFEQKFCQGYWQDIQGRRVWNSSGASHLSELSRLIRPFILYRSKQKLLGLPPKIREEHSVALNSKELLGFDHRLQLAIDDYHHRVEQGLACSNAEALAVLTALRQISAEFKLPAVSQLIKKLNEEKKPVVLFSSFVKPLQLIQSAVGGELLTGQQKLQEREDVVSRFQVGEVNLILATYGAGGLGYSLHRARHVILLERPWTPGDVEQAEDRCHRLGMDGPLISHWFQLGFADQLVDAIVANKAELIQLLMGVSRCVIKRQSIPAILSKCLQKSFDVDFTRHMSI